MIVTGKILDHEMAPIPHANVREVGTNVSTQADSDGNFLIMVASPNSMLQFSHAGFDFDTISASEFNSYIQLYPTTLDGVEVVADKKKDNTLLWILAGAATVFGIALVRKNAGQKPRKVSI